MAQRERWGAIVAANAWRRTLIEAIIGWLRAALAMLVMPAEPSLGLLEMSIFSSVLFACSAVAKKAPLASSKPVAASVSGLCRSACA